MSDELFPPDAITRAQLARLLHASSDLAILLDGRRTILYVNDSVLTNTGFRREDLLRRKVSALFRPSSRLAAANRIFGGLRKSGRWNGDLFFQRKGGSSFTTSAAVTPCPASSAASYLLMARVAGRRERPAHAPLFPPSSLQAVFDAAPDGIFV